METVKIDGKDCPVGYVHIIWPDIKGQKTYKVTMAYASTGTTFGIEKWFERQCGSLERPMIEHAIQSSHWIRNQQTGLMEVQTTYMGLSCYSKNEKIVFTKKEGRSRALARLVQFIALRNGGQ